MQDDGAGGDGNPESKSKPTSVGCTAVQLEQNTLQDDGAPGAGGNGNPKESQAHRPSPSIFDVQQYSLRIKYAGQGSSWSCLNWKTKVKPSS